jgi:multisubunit Na+/H+ antiporter MnhG subunit
MEEKTENKNVGSKLAIVFQIIGIVLLLIGSIGISALIQIYSSPEGAGTGGFGYLPVIVLMPFEVLGMMILFVGTMIQQKKIIRSIGVTLAVIIVTTLFQLALNTIGTWNYNRQVAQDQIPVEKLYEVKNGSGSILYTLKYLDNKYYDKDYSLTTSFNGTWVTVYKKPLHDNSMNIILRGEEIQPGVFQRGENDKITFDEFKNIEVYQPKSININGASHAVEGQSGGADGIHCVLMQKGKFVFLIEYDKKYENDYMGIIQSISVNSNSPSLADIRAIKKTSASYQSNFPIIPADIKNQINDSSNWETYSNKSYTIRYPKFLTAHKDSETNSDFQDLVYYRNHPVQINYLGDSFGCIGCVNNLNELADSPGYKLQNYTHILIDNKDAVKAIDKGDIVILIRVGNGAYSVIYRPFVNEKDAILDNMLNTLHFF